MFTNYLKVALRNLKKQKIYSFINISGLALGLAIYTLFSFLSVSNFKADKFHEKYMLLVIISNIIALPIAYLLSRGLLQLAWTTRIQMSIWIFIFAASVTLITAIVAVTSQTLKAARANPIESLRYE